MPASLNFRAVMPILGVMNAIAQVSAAPVSGSKLDNRRVMAAIVDLLIVTAGAVVVLVAGDSLSGDRQGALAAVILGWALYYFFALESGEGQTVGKKLMKLRVVRADGRPAGMREIGVRTILRVVDNYLVGLIVMLATGERRQRIGDLAAGTIVADASGLAAAPPAPVDGDGVGLKPDPVSEEEAEQDGPEAEADSELPASQTITLPPRPTPPATLTDLTEPEADEDVADEPVEDEPAAEVEVEDEPVEDEPVAEVPPVPVEPTVDVDEEPPAVMSPSLEELAEDVAAAHVEDDGPVNVKSVETVSAMDLIMGAAEEDSAAQEPDQDPEEPSAS
jgi:uncharacterized RDD family membrane protein YckC